MTKSTSYLNKKPKFQYHDINIRIKEFKRPNYSGKIWKAEEMYLVMKGRRAAMSEVSLEVRVPLNSDNFLRRECPNCERQFKQQYVSSDQKTTENNSEESIEYYFCPYCYEPAPPDTWWTKEQLEYVKLVALREFVEPTFQSFKQEIEAFNSSDSPLHIDVTVPPTAEPILPSEIDEMVRVDFPCHLEEPLKIDKAWENEVACLICGIQYPVDLVKALPEEM